MSDTTNQQQRPPHESPAAYRPLFWEAPVGAFESPEDYERFREDVFNDVRPTGPLEGVLVNDVALLIWEAARLRRIRRNILNLAFADAAEMLLNECFADLAPRDPELRGDNAQRANELRFGDDEEKRMALQGLKDAGITLEQVEARAYLLKMSEIDAIDRKTILIDKRREANLRAVRDTRSFLAAKLRQIMERTDARAAS